MLSALIDRLSGRARQEALASSIEVTLMPAGPQGAIGVPCEGDGACTWYRSVGSQAACNPSDCDVQPHSPGDDDEDMPLKESPPASST